LPEAASPISSYRKFDTPGKVVGKLTKLCGVAPGLVAPMKWLRFDLVRPIRVIIGICRKTGW
jgi:hypothetical protein